MSRFVHRFFNPSILTEKALPSSASFGEKSLDMVSNVWFGSNILFGACYGGTTGLLTPFFPITVPVGIIFGGAMGYVNAILIPLYAPPLILYQIITRRPL